MSVSLKLLLLRSDEDEEEEESSSVFRGIENSIPLEEEEGEESSSVLLDEEEEEELSLQGEKQIPEKKSSSSLMLWQLRIPPSRGSQLMSAGRSENSSMVLKKGCRDYPVSCFLG